MIATDCEGVQPLSAADIDAHIGSRLKHFRQSAGMSTAKLAETLGVSYQQVQKYEAGKNRLSVFTLKRISETLGMEVGAFFPDVVCSSSEGQGVTAAQVELAGRMDALDPRVRRGLRELIEALGPA